MGLDRDGRPALTDKLNPQSAASEMLLQHNGRPAEQQVALAGVIAAPDPLDNDNLLSQKLLSFGFQGIKHGVP